MSSEQGEEWTPEWTPERPATEKEQKICEEVMHQINERFKIIKAISYRLLQLFGGGEYDIKVYVGDDRGVRLNITFAFTSAGNTDYTVVKRQDFRIEYKVD